MKPQASNELSAAPAPPAESLTPAAPLDVAQEVRFAVVMYGGVSLAIYINGVAQELLRLVRATAPTARGGLTARPLPDACASPLDPSSLNACASQRETEWVYRKLSHLLSDPSLLEDYRKQLDGADAPKPGHDLVDEEVRNGSPVGTRFVVDILSGSSAGGINGLYLAKALANDQSMDELKKLWVEEGDIGRLINDKGSLKELTGLKNQKPPLSLLNSRRMYLKLLDALEGMESTSAAGDAPGSPYVDELDLFITTTDLEGMPLPLRLADKIVYERRHRNVFRFKYAARDAVGGEGRNDFVRDNNPFLAFAARATSSFPFAFEPMRLCDIDDLLELSPRYRGDDACKSSSARWQPYFTESIDPQSGKPRLHFSKRSFADGGDLDNKPFSYATETLARRLASVPVDRKLLYVEPSPEHPEDEPERDDKPDFLRNVKAALTDLPTYETIREDLQRVLERNRLVARVSRITSNIERDIARYDASGSRQRATARPQLQAGAWKQLYLSEMIDDFGIYYLPYRRLRISDTTDQMTQLVAHIANFDAESDQFTALRCLISAWRDRTYADYRAEDGKPTINQFLGEYDFAYRLRRLSYVRGKIDQLHRLASLTERGDARTPLGEEQEALVAKLRDAGLDLTRLDEKGRRSFRVLLQRFKCELNESFKELRAGGRTVRKGTNPVAAAAGQDGGAAGASFAEKIASLKITDAHLKFLLGMGWKDAQRTDAAQGFEADTLSESFDEACRARAKKLFNEPGSFGLPADLWQRLADAADALKSQLGAVLGPTSERCENLLDPRAEFPGFSEACRSLFPREPYDPDQLGAVRAYLWHYYSRFDDYDQISFPVLYETGVSEPDVVEVIRISPEDATSLVNERKEHRQKLAGVALFHFGAFLDRVWRQNDIMWGRLDGAERLITALLPGARDICVRARLLREAQTAIFLQELTPESRRELGLLMSRALVRASAGEGVGEAVERVIEELKSTSPIQKRLETVMRNSLADGELVALMSGSYEVDRRLDPRAMLEVMSRSTQVVGEMFEEVANSNGLDGKHLRWVARLGGAFWGLVELAVPNSILNRLVMHWLALLYFAEGVLLFGAILFGNEGVRRLSITLLAVTAAVNVTILLLRDMMRLRRGWLRLFVTFFVAVVLLLASVGTFELFQLGARVVLSQWFQVVRHALS
jgi:patatin-related protein